MDLTKNLAETICIAAQNESSNPVWIIPSRGKAIIVGAYGKILMSKKVLEQALDSLTQSHFCTYEKKYQHYKVTVLALLE